MNEYSFYVLDGTTFFEPRGRVIATDLRVAEEEWTRSRPDDVPPDGAPVLVRESHSHGERFYLRTPRAARGWTIEAWGARGGS